MLGERVRDPRTSQAKAGLGHGHVFAAQVQPDVLTSDGGERPFQMAANARLTAPTPLVWF